MPSEGVQEAEGGQARLQDVAGDAGKFIALVFGSRLTTFSLRLELLILQRHAGKIYTLKASQKQ